MQEALTEATDLFTSGR